MRDDKHIDAMSEKELTDVAWRQMEALLNEHQPLPAIPWWQRKRWAVLMLLFLFLGVGLLWGLHRISKAPVPVAASVTQTEPSGNATQQLAKSPAATTEASVSASFSKRAQAQVPLVPPTKASNSPSSISSTIPTLQSAPPAELAETLAASADANDIRLFQPVPGLYPGILPVNKSVPGSLGDADLSKPGLWSLAFTGSVGMAISNGSRTAGLDVRAVRALGNRKRWSLEAGIGLQAVQFPQFADLAAEFYFSPGDSSDFTPAEQEAWDVHSVPAAQLFYLKAPVELSYRMHRRIELRLGTTPAYLLSTAELFSAESLRFEGEVANVAQAARVAPASWDLLVSSGITYRINPKLGIDLRYQQGLLPIYPNSEKPFRNQLLEIGLRWNLMVND